MAAKTPSVAEVIEIISKLTPEQIQQIIEHSKDIFTREIAPHPPFVYDIIQDEDDQQGARLSAIRINEKFINEVKKNSAINVILMNQLKSIDELQCEYVELDGSYTYCNHTKCNCDLALGHIDTRTCKDHYTFSIINKSSINKQCRAYFFDDWLKNPTNKDYDEMFGHYEPLEGYEDVANLHVVNKASGKLFLHYKSMPRDTLRRLFMRIARDYQLAAIGCAEQCSYDAASVALPTQFIPNYGAESTQLSKASGNKCTCQLHGCDKK
jgi:hypothetical protein